MEILTVKDVARILKVSDRTLRRILAKGGIPAKKVGGQWRFIREEIEAWLIEWKDTGKYG